MRQVCSRHVPDNAQGADGTIHSVTSGARLLKVSRECLNFRTVTPSAVTTHIIVLIQGLPRPQLKPTGWFEVVSGCTMFIVQNFVEVFVSVFWFLGSVRLC